MIYIVPSAAVYKAFVNHNLNAVMTQLFPPQSDNESCDGCVRDPRRASSLMWENLTDAKYVNKPANAARRAQLCNDFDFCIVIQRSYLAMFVAQKSAWNGWTKSSHVNLRCI